jgi:ribosomal protein L29
LKKVAFISVALASALVANQAATMSNEEVLKELQKLKSELSELKATVKNSNLDGMKKELSAIKSSTTGDNLKFKADLRTSYDNIQYKYANGTKSTNKDLLSNRLLLGMEYQPREELIFKGQLSYNKAFGDTANHAQGNVNPGWSDFDWVENENLTDNTIKLKQAYMLYFGNAGDVPYTASFGRRPSTNGYPVNLRDDDDAQSPLGHAINVEFDGASFGFDLSNVTSVPGLYFKLCLGRGVTNAKPALSMSGDDYAKNPMYDNNDVDMYGFIFKPYDNGQYSIQTQFVWAENLMGFAGDRMMDYMTKANALNGTVNNLTAFMNAQNNMTFIDVGDYHGGTITLGADGIGEFISDYLDNTKAFVSYAYSQTSPSNKNVYTDATYGHTVGNSIGMLGSNEDKTGHSWYVR